MSWRRWPVVLKQSMQWNYSCRKKTCLLLLNALVLSHVQYPAILLQGISQNLLTTLEKQLSWGVKTCFNRQKQDSSGDLKIKHNMLPIIIFLDYKSCFYFWKHQNNLLPPSVVLIQYQQLEWKITVELRNLYAMHKSLKVSSYGFYPCGTAYHLVWSKRHFPLKQLKANMKFFFSNKIAKEIEQPQLWKKCWRLPL